MDPLLLMWIKKDSSYLAADGECTIEFDPKEQFLGTLKQDKAIEIQSFGFGISLMDTSASKDVGEDGKLESVGKFQKYILGTLGTERYPISLDEVRIERQIDKSSPVLMKYCFETTSVKTITIVKFKNSGSNSKYPYEGYLRVDFTDALISDLSWSTSDGLVKEEFKFVYRTVEVQYRPQNNDGSMGDTVNPGPLSLIKTAGGSAGGGSKG